MPILAILFTWGNGSSPRSQGGRSTQQRGLVMRTKGVGTPDARGRFFNRTGWDHEGDHVVAFDPSWV